MAITVRSADGSVQFKDQRQLVAGVNTGLVEPDDEVQLQPGGEWKRVRDVPGLHRRYPEFSHWYILALVLVLEGLFLRGILMFAVIAGTVMIHTLYVRHVRGSQHRRR